LDHAALLASAPSAAGLKFSAYAAPSRHQQQPAHGTHQQQQQPHQTAQVWDHVAIVRVAFLCKSLYLYECDICSESFFLFVSEREDARGIYASLSHWNYQ
jgi:hypothetical protein